MKAILIIFNQAHTEKVIAMLEELGVRGFTMWTNLMGRGSVDGDPHMNTHTWPEQNSGILSVVDSSMVDPLITHIKEIDGIEKSVGIRAFVWDITQAY